MGGYDAIILGGGHNGLTCGSYLARAGLRTVVLERRPVIGGAAVTEEIVPGFRFSVFTPPNAVMLIVVAVMAGASTVMAWAPLIPFSVSTSLLPSATGPFI